MPEPGAADLTIYQGDSFQRTVAFIDAAGGPVDLTGQTATAQIRATPASSEVLLALTCAIDDPASGLVVITATGEATAALTAGDIGVWDLELANGTTIRTWLRGKVHVGAQITREVLP